MVGQGTFFVCVAADVVVLDVSVIAPKAQFHAAIGQALGGQADSVRLH